MNNPLIIIGAGPVGCLLALFLSRRGFDVEMYERRPDIRRIRLESGRSINITLSTRGTHALHAAGLAEQVDALAMPMYGRMIHPESGPPGFQPYGKDEDHFLNAVSRGPLNALLLEHAERAHEDGAPGKVRIHFHQRLVDYDLDRREATFQDVVTGDTRRIDTPVIFGTDGTNSALRTALERQAGLECTTTTVDCGYKELNLPPVTDGRGMGPGGRFALAPNALHVWPRGRFMLIGMPNRDATFTCSLFLSYTAPPGEPSFATLTDAAATQSFFETKFPDVLAAMPNLGELLDRTPLSHMQTVKVWPWTAGSALLMGDSAHGIVPFFGQGMNAGFEDCMVFDKLLEQHVTRADSSGVDWPSLFAAFAEARKASTDAIADLAVDHFTELCDRVADPRFRLFKEVELQMEQRFPGRYISRYVLVSFTHIPYAVALQVGRIQDSLLGDLCHGLQRAEEVDWKKAECLVNERFVPFLRQHQAFA